MDKEAFEAGLSYQVDKQMTEEELKARRENFEKARAKAHELPLNPGCYLMRDASGTVIYVGKAKSLRKRVSQYFLPNRDRKTQALVEKIRDISHVITGNDYEALILENNLIKKYNPHYNILLKDGKSYPMIRITKEDFPKVYKTRRIIKDGSDYFGPYPDVSKMSQYLDLIDRLFSLRKCSTPLRKKPQPCLYYHIGRCQAPCCGKVSKAEYGKSIDRIRAFLSGKNDDLQNQLREEMMAASKEMQYEVAAKKRDLLLAVQSVSKVQMVEDYSNTESRDYAAIEMRSPLCTVSLMQFRDGKLIGRALYRAQTFGDESETLLNFLTQYYEDGQQMPNELYVSHEIDIDLISRYFQEYLKKQVKVFVPKEGRDFRILRMAAENASRDVEKRLKSRDNSKALELLQEVCGLEEPPELIEGFDIAQLNGKYTVASLISFVNGNPNPSGYRRFNIRSLNGAIDDFGAMREAITRRYSRVIEENLQKPGLILIDGGKGQVNVARDVLDELGLADVPVVGLAKQFETIVFDDDRPDLRLDHSNDALRVLIAVRDECHRFATGANQAMRSKEASFHLLQSVPGIGKVSSDKIMNAFTTLDDVVQCSPEEISQRAGIPIKTAENLLARLKV
ncbi:MAG: excinuclease ABC subunit UvrC [Sphaerochaetaceae bacterium]|nr:excinuclease ABC subunit UvrC [Sphaerochaetaceae bacterium]